MDTEEAGRLTGEDSSFGWVVVAAGILIFTVTWGAPASLGVFLNDAVAELGWTRSTYSIAQSIFVGLGMGLSALWGWSVDRWSPRLVAVLCGALMGAGFFLSSYVTVAWQFYLTLGVLGGLGLGAFAPVTMAPVSRWFSRRRGLALGVLTGGVGVGFVVMPQVAQQLVDFGDWRLGFRGLGILIWASIAVGFWFLREPPWFQEVRLAHRHRRPGELRPQGDADTRRGMSLGQALRSPAYWVLGLMFIGVIGNKELVVLHLVPSGRELGMAGVLAASLMTVFGGVSVVAKFFAGYWADRVGPHRLFVMDLGLQVVAMIGLSTGAGALLFFGAAALSGLTYGAWVPLMPVMTAAAFGTRAMGAIYGSLMLVAAVGAMGGPYLGGWLFDASGSYTIAYAVGAVIAALAAALGIVFGRMVSHRAPAVPAPSRGRV